MNKKILGLILGFIAGIVDVTPMILQNLPWDANISAFSMWIIVGFFIAAIDLKIHYILKGIVVSFLSLLPCAVLIAWKEPFTLIPVSIMTLILGTLLGVSIEKLGKKVSK